MANIAIEIHQHELRDFCRNRRKLTELAFFRRSP
jgi:hypothetical protein